MNEVLEILIKTIFWTFLIITGAFNLIGILVWIPIDKKQYKTKHKTKQEAYT